MIWLIFKNCSKSKSKSINSDKTKQLKNPKKIIQELLSKLDEFHDSDQFDDNVFITDKHFDCLSILDPCHKFKESSSTIKLIETDHGVIENGVKEVDDLERNIENNLINNRCIISSTTIVTEKHLKSLECPFNWNLELDTWNKNIVNRIENKYGKYNMNISSIRFSFEKYISNLIISCGLFKMNQIDQAYDKLINIWEWLDKLEDENEPFFLAIRDGLKHIIMATLCHVLFTFKKTQCKQLLEMITQFNRMNLKSKASVYAVRAAVCIDIGGIALQNAVYYAKKTCELDSDNAYWNYLYSVAMTAERQYLNTNKSCPTEAEFDAIQRAVILTSERNPYFNYHRMVLMQNKILYHYCIDNINRNEILDGYSSKKIQQDFQIILDLIKQIMGMEPEDPHLVVKCVKSLISLPYFHEDNIYLMKQVISIAVNMAFNDPTVILAINKNIEIYGELVSINKELNEKKRNLKCINIQNQVNRNDGNTNKEDVDLENDFKLIVKNQNEDSKPIVDLIKLLTKYDGNSKWKIMAQICSYSILFKDSTNLMVGVEQFMMLISDKMIANSDIVTNHRSIFIENHSKVFNLAELVCNEIKLAIVFNRTKNREEIQFYLDQLTKIIEVCQLKSKEVNPTFLDDLIECKKEKKQVIPQQIEKVNRENGVKETNIMIAQHSKKQRRPKQTLNNSTQVLKSKPRRQNYRKKNYSK